MQSFICSFILSANVYDMPSICPLDDRNDEFLIVSRKLARLATAFNEMIF